MAEFAQAKFDCTEYFPFRGPLHKNLGKQSSFDAVKFSVPVHLIEIVCYFHNTVCEESK